MNTKKTISEDSFNFKKIVSRLLDNWKLFALSVIGFILLGLFYTWYATPAYNVNAQLLIEDDQSSSKSSSLLGTSSGMADFGDLFGSQSNVYNELGILHSHDLLEKVVRNMHLNVKYFIHNGIKTTELYSRSPFNVAFLPKNDSTLLTTCDLEFSDLGKKNRFEISVSNDLVDTTFFANFNDTIRTPVGKLYFTRTGKAFEDETYGLTLTSVDFVIANLVKDLLVEINNGEATIIDLSYKTNVPLKGENVLSNLINEYVKRDLNEKNRISDSSLAFINSRITIVNGDLNNIESQIQSFKQSNKIADLTEQSRVLIDNTSTYNQKLNELEVQQSVAKSTLQYIQDEKTNERPVPSVLSTDPTFLSLVQKYNTLLIERDRFSLSVSENNPLSKNLEVQISNLRNDLIKSLQSQIKATNIGMENVRSENSVMSNMVNNVPVQEREFVNLSREQSVKQALYLYLLQKKEETAITEASTLPNANVISRPKSDYNKYFPQLSLILVASVFLGLFLPTLFVILKYALNTRINSREDITEATDCNILAEIGHDSNGALLPMKEQNRAVIVEQFRAFRTNMGFLIGQKKCPRILVTSSMGSEGKSFISGNLAQIYGLSDKRVVLLEMDFRKPHISTMFNISNKKGITNYIVAGGGRIQDYIQPVPDMPNVFLISSGPVPPNPAELLMTPIVSAMFDELSDLFDLIIIDSPPIGFVTDAQILTKYADVNLFILREKYSFKNSLEIVNDLLENGKFSNLYIVVNDVRKSASSKYGYGNGYGYGYGYGDGYGYGTNNDAKGKRRRKKKTLVE